VAFIPFSRLRSVQTITDPVKINQARAGWVYGVSLRTVNRSLDLWAKTEKEQLMWVEALSKAVAEHPVSLAPSKQGNMANSFAESHSLSSLNIQRANASSSQSVVSSSLGGTIFHRAASATTPTPETGEEGAHNHFVRSSTTPLALKEVPKASWDAISEEEDLPVNTSATQIRPPIIPTVIRTGTRWDDWDANPNNQTNLSSH
jgi:hypothetical protein